EYLTQTFAAVKNFASQIVSNAAVGSSEPVTLVDYDADAETKIIAAGVYPHAHQSFEQLRGLIKKKSGDRQKQKLVEGFNKRRHRRDKPGRAFENVYYTFDILGNLGLYRDLHRHRILTQERQDFATVHGYDTPQEIEEAGFKSEFDNCMKHATDLYEQIYRDL